DPHRARRRGLGAGGQNWQTRVTGVTPNYEDVRNFHVDFGDFISQSQPDERASVIVLGSAVAENLFGGAEPIGQTVRVSVFGRTGTNARVIGVMATKGGSGLLNQDDQAFMPLTTVMTRLNPARNFQTGNLITGISVQVVNEEVIDE